ncbi:hypothetical protein L1049_017834 [Liquidambar formosana]|uniref:Protein PLASTID MOVEMENT IMPAIRED 1-RELATED 1 n=1 Tax=Liquidambar formosana TaxID=63359 RepID=A0AAP0R7H8_LIQFO
MLSKVESATNSSGDSNNGQLLRDIEAISKALYLHKPPPKGLISPPNNRSKSAGKTRFLESKLNSKPYGIKEDLLYKDKKSSIWNWKKPLKALTHIRNWKFSCCFFLHVHSIEGLPANFNGINLCVNWRRKDEVVRTRPLGVDRGMVEFEETLMHQCSVYGHRSGPQNSAKYEVKLFLVYGSVIGAPGLDIGKHWVDLTRLLPLTLEELEGEKSLGKWTTSFKLAGKAEGATLNVSFGYSVMGNNSGEPSSDMNVPELLNLKHSKSSTMENVAAFGPGKLQRVGSVPSNKNYGSHPSSQSMDVKVHEVLPNPGSELSRSINFLYKKIDEAKLGSLTEVDLFSEHLLPLKLKPDSFSESAEEHFGNECDDVEFTVIEQGIELSTKEELKLAESADQSFDGYSIETINVDEIIKGDEVFIDEEMKCNINDDIYGNCNNEIVVDECKYKGNNACTKDSTMEDLESALDSPLLQESADLDSPLTMSEFLRQENYIEVRSNDDERNKMVKSLSFDDLTESVANDFLNMLEIEHSPHGLSSDSDPESPREHLLRQFEKEALASGSFIFDIDVVGEEAEVGCSTPTAYRTEDFPEDSEMSLDIQAFEQEHRGMRQSLITKRKAKMLENLETEALMREWGLNEMAFKSSPRSSSGGFGSPIDLSPEEPPELPPLGEGLGPFFQMEGGGFLRSMSPLLFKNAKNGGSLIMQVSSPVVLPAEMGSTVMEILQHLASIGIEKLSMQANNLMPLEDITGKTMQQVAWEAATILEVPDRMALLRHESEVGQDSFDRKMEAKGFPCYPNYDNLNSSSITGEMGSDYVSLEDLVPLAMDKFEALSIEGLRIQSNMSNEGAPSSICSHAFAGVSAGVFLGLEGAAGLQSLNVGDSGSDVDGLLDLSITLDEWLRLDARIINDEDHISEHTLKILTAHHAKCTDMFNRRLTRDREWGEAYGGKYGLLGNNLTVAFMVQLRDPLRNYEPVGAPMFALIQVERVYVPLKPKLYCPMSERSNKEDYDEYEAMVKKEINDERKEERKEEKKDDECILQFKITEVHVAGLNTEPDKNKLWGTTAQQRSGSRWLLASGMGKTNKHPFLKSKAIVKSSPLATAKVHPRDSLWSISSCVHSAGAKWKELSSLNLHIRNPDVIFLNETIRLQ